MPDWNYHLWSEDNFDIASAPAYVQEAHHPWIKGMLQTYEK